MDGITNGFKIIPDNLHLEDSTVDNYRSATNPSVRVQVEKQILTEIQNGNCFITTEKPTIVSALGAIPKPDSSDIRLIHDCSRPESTSLNSYASCEHYSYETVDKVTANIKQGAYMTKIDLKSAYRHVPIHPSNYRATGLKWTFTNEHTFTYLYDTKLPFGAKRSPEIFHRLTQSITRMMKQRGFFVVAYLDDFLIISDTEHECWTAFWELVNLLERLGLSVNWNKVTHPCQRLVYLGIEIDSMRRQLSLSDRKLQEIKLLLNQAIAKTKFTKRELQSVAGKLYFAARVVYGGRTFLRRIIDAINTLKCPYHRTRMTETLRNDILWWINFMEHFNGTTYFVASEPTTTSEFSTDASLVGGGGHFRDD